MFVGGTALLWTIQSHFAWHTDDAYITYRYAQHIAAGDGFVYNPGERVLGTTTPLYTLLLAGCARAGADIPTASMIINVVAGALTLMLVFVWLARSTERLIVGFTGVAILLSFEQFVQFSISGMETSLYVLLILATFLLYDTQRLVLCAVLAGLCVLVRLDGAAVGAALVLHYVCANRKPPPLRLWIGYAIVTLPWFVFAWWYFGDFRPQSMLAKHHHMLESSRYWMLEFLARPSNAAMWPLFFLGGAAALREHPKCGGLAAIGLWGVLYATAFTVYRIDLYLWYLTPLTVCIAVLTAFGLGMAAIALERKPLSGAHRVGTLALIVIALAPVLAPRWNRVRDVLRGAIHWARTLEQSRADAAAYVESHGTPNDVIATGAIGIVGWQTQAFIYDVLGLVTRNAVGRPLDEILRESNARWYISETPATVASYAHVPGFRMVGRFARKASPVAFLVYERGAATRTSVTGQVDDPFTTDTGLCVEFAALSENAIELR
ncbi:MAG: hypothetical protein D6744_14400, partial [Planctomycetota bacterium]